MTPMTSPISRPIRLLLLGPNAIVRAGLRLLVENGSKITVVGETASSSEAVRIASQEQPDIILVDLNNRDAHLEFLPSLIEVTSGSRVVVLMEGPDEELSQSIVRLGATGIVFKDKAPEVLIAAIERVHAGEAWLDRHTIARVLTELSCGKDSLRSTPDARGIALLTKREREVITLVALGLRNQQIAERLFISEITVRHHLTHVFDKLAVSDRFELMIYAYRNGLADLPEDPTYKLPT